MPVVPKRCGPKNALECAVKKSLVTATCSNRILDEPTATHKTPTGQRDVAKQLPRKAFVAVAVVTKEPRNLRAIRQLTALHVEGDSESARNTLTSQDFCERPATHINHWQSLQLRPRSLHWRFPGPWKHRQVCHMLKKQGSS